MKKQNKILMFSGLFLWVVSYSSFLSHNFNLLARHPGVLLIFFCLGTVFISESILRQLHNRSLAVVVFKSPSNVVKFLLASIVSGLILEGILKWTGKLYIYPYWTFFKYWAGFVPGFALYWLTVGEAYLAIKAVLVKYRLTRALAKQITKPYSYEAEIFTRIGLAGLVIFITTTLIIIIQYSNQPLAFASTSDVYAATNNFRVSLLDCFFAFLGVWLCLEWIEYKQRRTSLIKDMLHHNWVPLAAICCATLILGTIMEVQNLPAQYWSYIHIPLANVTYFGIPVLVLLLGWPAHYILFLSVFRIITKDESQGIWEA